MTCRIKITKYIPKKLESDLLNSTYLACTKRFCSVGFLLAGGLGTILVAENLAFLKTTGFSILFTFALSEFLSFAVNKKKGMELIHQIPIFSEMIP